jgi:hypothetical protein
MALPFFCERAEQGKGFITEGQEKNRGKGEGDRAGGMPALRESTAPS